MAQKVSVLLIDDLDGGEATETLGFALDGTDYEMDLSASNADKLRKGLSDFIEHARRVTGQKKARTYNRTSPAPSRTTASRDDLAAIRAWAKTAGIEVKDRGRIPQSVTDQYHAAH